MTNKGRGDIADWASRKLSVAQQQLESGIVIKSDPQSFVRGGRG